MILSEECREDMVMIERRDVGASGRRQNPLDCLDFSLRHRRLSTRNRRRYEHGCFDDEPSFVCGGGSKYAERAECCCIECEFEFLRDFSDGGIESCLTDLRFSARQHEHVGSTLANVEHPSSLVAHDNCADANDLFEVLGLVCAHP